MVNSIKPLFSGKIAFMLYDTYGFPLELTQSILAEKGIEINVEEFNEAMAEQKKRAKENWVGSGDVRNSKIYFDIKEKIVPTEFVGYNKNTTMGKILAIIKDEKEVNEIKAGDEFEFFVDKTSFYGECGGQVGDTGLAIKINENGVIPLPFSTVEIIDVKRPFSNYFLHKGKLQSGNLKVGDYLNLSINVERRNKIRANHSATHLLQYALRKIFGDTLIQKGSYIDEFRLRFDFALNKSITKEQIENIENIVNELIFKNTPVETKILQIEEAKKYGAMALFNEKYDDVVRVLFMGEKSYENNDYNNKNLDSNSIECVSGELDKLNNSSLKSICSIELCGGTHVFKTGEIGLFKIVNEESVSSGVRRIEAVTGLEAIKYMNNFQNIVYDINKSLQVDLNSIVAKVQTIIDENKQFKKQLDNIRKSKLTSISFTEEENNVKFAYVFLKDVDPKDVKGKFIDVQNKKYSTNSVLLCIVGFDGKITIILGVSKDLNDKIKANDIIKELTTIAGGNGGGGQPWFAMGGATNQNNPQTITNIIECLRNKISKI